MGFTAHWARAVVGHCGGWWTPARVSGGVTDRGSVAGGTGGGNTSPAVQDGPGGRMASPNKSAKPQAGGPARSGSDAWREAITYLHGHGAWLVLCCGKKPVWGVSWNRRRTDLDLVIAHGSQVGLIPISIQTSALDVDFGDIGELVKMAPPLATLKSPRGHHCYYRDGVPRGNARWKMCGCRGEVRSAKGYLRLYEGGAETLACAMRIQPEGDGQWPQNLFEMAGVDLPLQMPPVSEAGFLGAASTAMEARTRWDLRKVHVGCRNLALFDELRFWAYVEPRGGSVQLWHAKVHRRAFELAALLQEPLPDREVRQTAYSVSSWVWAGGGPIDHSGPAQSRRGVKSGKVRREQVRERDAAVLGLVLDEYVTYREAGRASGVSKSQIGRIVHRDAQIGYAVSGEARKREWVEQYRAGKSLREIATATGAAKSSIHDVVRYERLLVPGRDPAELADWIRRKQEGESIRAIARATGADRRVVSKALKANTGLVHVSEMSREPNLWGGPTRQGRSVPHTQKETGEGVRGRGKDAGPEARSYGDLVRELRKKTAAGNKLAEAVLRMAESRQDPENPPPGTA